MPRDKQPPHSLCVLCSTYGRRAATERGLARPPLSWLIESGWIKSLTHVPTRTTFKVMGLRLLYRVGLEIEAGRRRTTSNQHSGDVFPSISVGRHWPTAADCSNSEYSTVTTRSNATVIVDDGGHQRTTTSAQHQQNIQDAAEPRPLNCSAGSKCRRLAFYHLYTFSSRAVGNCHRIRVGRAGGVVAGDRTVTKMKPVK